MPSETTLQTYLKAFYDLQADAKSAMTEREFETWQMLVTLRVEQVERGRVGVATASGK